MKQRPNFNLSLLCGLVIVCSSTAAEAFRGNVDIYRTPKPSIEVYSETEEGEFQDQPNGAVEQLPPVRLRPPAARPPALPTPLLKKPIPPRTIAQEPLAPPPVVFKKEQPLPSIQQPVIQITPAEKKNLPVMTSEEKTPIYMRKSTYRPQPEPTPAPVAPTSADAAPTLPLPPVKEQLVRELPPPTPPIQIPHLEQPFFTAQSYALKPTPRESVFQILKYEEKNTVESLSPPVKPVAAPPAPVEITWDEPQAPKAAAAPLPKKEPVTPPAPQMPSLPAQDLQYPLTKEEEQEFTKLWDKTEPFTPLVPKAPRAEPVRPATPAAPALTAKDLQYPLTKEEEADFTALWDKTEPVVPVLPQKQAVITPAPAAPVPAKPVKPVTPAIAWSEPPATAPIVPLAPAILGTEQKNEFTKLEDSDLQKLLQEAKPAKPVKTEKATAPAAPEIIWDEPKPIAAPVKQEAPAPQSATPAFELTKEEEAEFQKLWHEAEPILPPAAASIPQKTEPKPVKAEVKADSVKVAAAPVAPVVKEPMEEIEAMPAAAETIAQNQQAPAPAVPEHSDMTLTFAANSSTLTPQTLQSLDSIATQMNDLPDMRLQIRAYAADGESNQSSARRMSLSRGLAVRAYLMERGVKPVRLDVRALGSVTERTPVDRVDLIFVK